MRSGRETARKWCDGVALACWLAFGLACLLNWARPGMSFDLVPYLGLTAAADVTNDRQVQTSAYEELRKIADARQWHELTEQNAYVRQMKADPLLFSRDIGDYRIKWGYVGLARTLDRWMPPYPALRLITLASLIILFCATIWLLWTSDALQSLFIIPPVLMAGELNYVIGSTTPDMLALALAALLLVAWLASARRWSFMALSACCVAVRPDMIFMIAGIFAAALLFRRARFTAGSAFACSVTVVAVERLATSYAGWWQHVSAALYGSTAVVAGAPPFSFTGYAAAWLWQMVRIAATGAYLYVIVLLLVAYVGLTKQRTSANHVQDVLFYGVLAGLLGRMIVFPTTEARFFLPTLFMMSILLAIRLRPDFSQGIASALTAWFAPLRRPASSATPNE